jgi:D-lactate dehydrogenase
MKVFFFSVYSYDRESFNAVEKPKNFEFTYHPSTLSEQNASIAEGHDAICIFVNDTCNAEVLRILQRHGVRAVLLRCAGFNNVDVDAANELGIFVARVPGIETAFMLAYI